MKTAVVVFSPHLKLESLTLLKERIGECSLVCLTPHFVYENERVKIGSLLGGIIEYVCFADVITDAEAEQCDFESFIPYQELGRLSLQDSANYFEDLNIMKNQILVKKIEQAYNPAVKIVMGDDLGVVAKVWQDAGYQYVCGDYVYSSESNNGVRVKVSLMNKVIRKSKRILRKYIFQDYPQSLYVARKNGKTFFFHGNIDRAGYKIALPFRKSILGSIWYWIIKMVYGKSGKLILSKNVVNMTTLHEWSSCAYMDMIDIPEANNFLFQDGLLPSNDTCRYLFFYGRNSHFWSWDKLGNKLFEYHSIPVEIFPYRINYELPQPHFRPIKKVLIVASGAGNWTAIKNRSDEEKTAVAIAEVARRYPDIEFVYRCHPTWISPVIQGVNSIQRLVEYFDSTGLKNITLSSNIPSYYDKFGNKIASQKRSSLSEDLQSADFVFGVHSISMIDAALQNIPFASINMSGRRNLFQSISELGFPHCESVEEIACVLDSVLTSDFQKQYLQAVENYNRIIEEK